MATDRIGPLVQEYVDAAYAALPVKPGRVITMQPGEEVAWDFTCEGGQLHARIVTIQPGPTVARANGLPCGIPHWDVTVGLGLLRCIAVVNDKGKAPSDAAVSADGQLMLDDLATLQEVVTCVGQTRQVLAWSPLGPQGGYAGGEFTFVVRLNSCGCPDPAPWDASPEV